MTCLDFHAGDRRVGAELLESDGIELPRQGVAGLGDGRHTILEDEGELDPRIAYLPVERVSELAEKRGERGVSGV